MEAVSYLGQEFTTTDQYPSEMGVNNQRDLKANRKRKSRSIKKNIEG